MSYGLTLNDTGKIPNYANS